MKDSFQPAGLNGDTIDDAIDDPSTGVAPGDDIWAATTGSGDDEPPSPDETVAMADVVKAPRGAREWFEATTSWVIVGLVTIFVISQLQPGDILTAAVPTGGDMGSHVWAPAYLRDHLLSRGRLSGWSMDWYSGLPVYRFYMIPPALAILALDVVLPYGMAMKIVAVLGCVTLPVCLYAFGRLSRLPYPLPAMFAVAGAVFLFDETFTILGGNIASTMAGEFSFSISLSLAMLALGVMARGMENGRHRVLAAVLLALAALCHGLVMIFVAVGAVLLWLISIDGRRFVWGLTTGATAVLLTGFWFFPFVLTTKFMTDMKYEGAPVTGGEWNNYWKMFFPHSADVDRFWTTFALIGFVVGVIRRHRVVSFLGVYLFLLVAGVFGAKEGIPGFGLLWNVRLLPFIYLLRYLLAMVGIAEVVWGVLRWRRDRRLAELAAVAGPDTPVSALAVGRLHPVRVSARKFYTSIAMLGMCGAVGIGLLSWHLGKFPGQKEVYRGEAKTESEKWRFEWLGIDLATSRNNGFVDGWAKHNFTGYEGKQAYGEYKALIETMQRLGADPAHGCGRAMWEHTGGEYGTPMALMLLPFWTDSCIGSSEGLYFEASATTPYHFIASAAVSKQASNPVRGLTYEDRNAEIGARYLQTLGMRYYMAFNPETIERAAQQREFIEVARSGPWVIYEVAGSDLVTPMAIEPVVVSERDGDQREMWLEVGMSWFQHPEKWAALPAADGPPGWQRVDVVSDDPKPYPKVDVVRPSQPVQTRNLEPVVVSDVRLGDESVSFRVDKTNVPVLVRVSWFPNWKVSGALGPYRIAPNMMVVVPTSNEVRLTYGVSAIDYGAWLATLFGLVCLVVLWRRGPVAYRPDDQWDPYPADPDPFGPEPAPWDQAPMSEPTWNLGTDDPYPDGQYPDGQYPDDRLHGDRFPAGRFPTDGSSTAATPDDDGTGMRLDEENRWGERRSPTLAAPVPGTRAEVPPPPPTGYGDHPHD